MLEHFVADDLPEYEGIETQITVVEIHLKTVREKCNKHLGHLDLHKFAHDYPVTLAELSQAVSMLERIFNAIVKHLPPGLSFDPEITYVLDMPNIDRRADARAVLIMMERGRRFKKMVEELPEECLMSFIPENDRFQARSYFQGDILHYIDARPKTEDREPEQ